MGAVPWWVIDSPLLGRCRRGWSVRRARCAPLADASRRLGTNSAGRPLPAPGRPARLAPMRVPSVLVASEDVLAGRGSGRTHRYYVVREPLVHHVRKCFSVPVDLSAVDPLSRSTSGYHPLRRARIARSVQILLYVYIDLAVPGLYPVGTRRHGATFRYLRGAAGAFSASLEVFSLLTSPPVARALGPPTRVRLSVPPGWVCSGIR